MILAWLGTVALVGAAAIGVRSFLNRYDSLGRRRAFPWFSVGGLVLVGTAALVPFFLRLRLEARLSSAASAIVGQRVGVRCQAFGEAFVDAGQELGYVRFGPDGIPERQTLIKRQQCRDLAAYVRDPSGFTPDHAVAVHTLTHEAIHMMGITNEAQTECLAVQRDAEMARLLGASDADADRLARYYWENVVPRMPDNYRSPDCPGPVSD